MIRYGFAPDELQSRVDAVDPTWQAKAARRTQALIKAGRYAEKTSIWSSVKEVFMRLQMNKCAFCERQFENPEYGRIEFDVEHFRPKSSVSAWPDPVRHAALRYAFATGAESAAGYYWLAYDLGNYAASCKVCNTIFKANFFPVGAERVAGPGADLAAEKAYLCYPLGSAGEDPEKVVTFVATTAVPARKTGHANRRGRLIIDFFGLNAREQLHRERARMMSLFGGALAARHAGTASASDIALLKRLKSPDLPHAACLRAFEKTWRRDPALAADIHDACRVYAVSAAGVTPPAF